jgi:sulfite exporter TauE/SafE
MLLTAFILGLAGSLHCAGMCGPLALAVPVIGNQLLVSRLIYNTGRLATYATLGLGAGLFGKALAFAGFQRWLSLGAGAALLIGLFFTKFSGKQAAVGLVAAIKRTFAVLLRRRSYGSILALGATNGLLPCGLVYVAATAAAASGSALGGAEYMLAFGTGTLPMMLAVPLLGRSLKFRYNVQKLIPVSVTVVALLLILRGLSLGIPYLSPDLSSGTPHCPACH